jgi:hypothetical protein
MKAEQEGNHLLNQTNQESIADKEKELLWLQGIEREQIFLVEFYTYSPAVSIVTNPKIGTSFLHTFGEAISAFGVFCLKMFELMRWPVKLLRRKGPKRLQ